jgi:hypothetical protein
MELVFEIAWKALAALLMFRGVVAVVWGDPLPWWPKERK